MTMPVLPCPLGPCLPSISGLAQDTAGGVISALTSAVTDAASWLIGQVLQLVTQTTSPQLMDSWFSAEASLMVRVAATAVLPLLLAASIGPILRQDARRLARVWLVGLPAALLGGMAAPQLAATGLSVTDNLCSLVAGSDYSAIGRQFADAMSSGALGSAPPFVRLAVDALAIVGAELLWLELTVRSAAVLVGVFFMPVALAAFVWPATASVARRMVELLCALILSKFVIVAALALGTAALDHGGGGAGGVDSVMSAAAILLMAAFSPFVLLRLAPIVEAGAIGHLEGLSRAPLQAAARIPGNPAAQFLLSRSGTGSTVEPQSVVSQMLPERQPDYPTGGGSD